MNVTVKFSLPVTLALTVAFLTGCATPPPVDWDSRVGHYTYDQAITELGSPDRQARLSDGKVVSKWIARPNAGPRLNSGMSYYGSSGFSTGQTIGSSINSQTLQLTFDPDGKLTAWSRNY
jgi:hypothetical protein